MQYFIGIAPPPEISETIVLFQKSIPNNHTPFLFEPHITIKGPDGLTEDMVWIDLARNVLKNFQKIEIILNGIDTFENKVLFLRPFPAEKIVTMHRKLLSALKSTTNVIEGEFENERYIPHLTLAATKWGITKEALLEASERGKNALSQLQAFQLSSARIYRQYQDDEPYHVFEELLFR